MSAYIKNQSLLGSEKNVLTVVYAEDKRLRDKFCDLRLACEGERMEIDIAQELGERQTIVLEGQGQWQSLAGALGVSVVKFSEVEATTFLIWTEEKARLGLKVVCGDVGENGLENVVEISQEVWVNLQQSPQNA